MPREAAYKVPPHVLSREVDGQMVLLDVDREEYFGLNEIGADIVAAITAGPFDEALDAVASRYDVDAVTVRADAEELIAALLAAELLIACDSD